MTALREAAQQALEACKLIVSAFDALKPASAARNEPLQINAARASITALEAALAEPEYPLGQATTDVVVRVYVVKKAEPVQDTAFDRWWDNALDGPTPVAPVSKETARWIWNAARAEPVQEPDLSRCPKCNGPADNGHDREVPPNPYYCTKCMAEPVAWRWGYRSVTTGEMDWRGYVEIAAHPNLRSPEIIMEPLYAAPPQRKPLTEEEIVALIHPIVMADMPDEMTDYEISRAIEEAVWKKNS